MIETLEFNDNIEEIKLHIISECGYYFEIEIRERDIKRLLITGEKYNICVKSLELTFRGLELNSISKISPEILCNKDCDDRVYKFSGFPGA